MHITVSTRGVGVLVVFAAAVVVADDAAAPVTSEQLFPLTERSAEFEYKADDGPPERISYSVERAPAEEGEGVWVVKVGAHRTTLVKRDAAGNVVILREDLHDDDNRLTYDPPIVLAPAKIAAGQTVTSESTMTVTRISSGARRTGGKVVRTFTVDDTRPRKVDTAGGEVAAVVVKAHDVAKFPLAKSEGDMEFAYAPKRGLVRFVESHHVRKVGLFNSTTRDQWTVVRETPKK